MNRASPVGLVGGATWMGAWIESIDEHGTGQQVTTELPGTSLGAPKIARADRLTRLAVAVIDRAVAGLAPLAGERVATVGGSVLSSLQSNERYERRRLGTGRAPPRDFSYTAPNAWLGGIAAALDARGPCLCLVGSSDVGLAGIATAIRMLSNHACDRAVVVVAECLPQDRCLLPDAYRDVREGASAAVFERVDEPEAVTLRAGWGEPLATPSEAWPSSIEAFARVIDSARSGRGHRVHAPTRAGASCWVQVVAERGDARPRSTEAEVGEVRPFCSMKR